MNLVELVRLFADPLQVAVVLTDTDLERPGPTVLYANPAFGRMSGYDTEEVLGRSPRLLQGPGTSREVTRLIQRGLRLEGRFLGCVQNYRKGGEAYLCEIDVRAVRRRDGLPEAYIAFEREMVRRRGRPTRGSSGRFRPLYDGAVPFVEDAAPLFS